MLTYTGTPVGQTVCRGNRVVLEAGQAGSSYQWYRNGTTAANKLIDVAGVQQGTRTASLTLVSVQTTATYYCVVTSGTTNQTTGPFVVTVNFGCTSRQAADEPLAALTVLLAPNPLENNRLRATVRGAGGQPVLAELTDLRGYVLRREQWAEAPPELTLDWEVSQGTPLLLLRVSTGGQQQTLKVFNP